MRGEAKEADKDFLFLCLTERLLFDKRVSMKTKHHQIDSGSKEAFMAKVTDLWPVAKGSLSLTHSPCIRKNCTVCASGRKHPKLLFTFREDGKLKGLYVRPVHAERVRRAVANGRELEKRMADAGRELVLALRKEAEA